MQGWSRMAALMTVLAGLVLIGSTRRASANDDGKEASTSKATGRVDLRFVVTGLRPGVTEVEILPGNGACQFKPRTIKLDPTRNANLDYVDLRVRALEVSTLREDRECSLAISIKEPGQIDRFARRGFRLNADAASKTQALTYYLNSTTLASKSTDETRRVR